MASNRLGLRFGYWSHRFFTTNAFFVIAVTALLLSWGHSYGIKTPLGEKVMNRIRNRMIAAIGCALLALPSAAFAGLVVSRLFRTFGLG